MTTPSTALDESVSAESTGETAKRLVGRFVTPATVHYAILAAGFVLIMVAARNHWFYGDEWDFITNRGLFGDLSIWWPHMEHWSTLPILVWRAMQSVFGLHTYLPYLALNVALHCGVAHALWRIMRRCGVAAWIGTALSAVFLFYGTGYESVGWAFQITFNGALLLGLCGLLALDNCRPDGLRWAIAGTACFLAGMTVAGITMMFVPVGAAVAYVRSRNWRLAVLVAAVPGAAFALWFLMIGHVGLGVGTAISGKSGGSLLLAGLLGAPRFVWDSFTASLDGLWGAPGVGGILVAALAGFVVLGFGRSEIRGKHLLVMATSTIGILSMTTAGIGRVGPFGPAQAQASRYLYIAFALLVPLLGAAASELAARKPLGPLLVWGLAVTALLWGGVTLALHLRNQAIEQQGQRAGVLAGARVLADGHEPAPHALAKTDPWGLPASELGQLIDAGQVQPPVEVDTTAYLDARSMIQVSVVQAGVAPATGIGPGKGCRTITNDGEVLDYDVERGGAVKLESDETSAVEVSLDTAEGVSDWRPIDVPPGPDTRLVTTAVGDTLRIRLPEGDPPRSMTVCG